MRRSSYLACFFETTIYLYGEMGGDKPPPLQRPVTPILLIRYIYTG